MSLLPLSTWGDAEQAHLMQIAMAVFFLLLLVASIAGLPVDSRDSADWKPTHEGFRIS
jgi:hypothetical protein